MSKKRKFNKGFTLVELLVVIVIFAIVASLSITGLLSWQDYADFNRNNEYAETLFVAAQNQLAEYSANGKLKDFEAELYGYDNYEDYEEAIANGDEMPAFNKTVFELYENRYTKLINSDGDNYSTASLWPEAVKKKAGTESLYMDRIVALRADMGDYDVYQSNPDQLKKDKLSAYLVFELLDDYVYDKSILSGGRDSSASICVELTASNGQVFSVLYSDKHDNLKYVGLGEKEAGNCADITNRTEDARQPLKVGYYGVDTLYSATLTDKFRPSLSSITLIDDNYFYLKSRLVSSQRSKTGMFDYTIDLLGSKDADDKLMTIKVKGSELKAANGIDLADSAATALGLGTVNGHVTRYNDNKTIRDEQDYKFIAWVDEDYYINLILDAADIQAQTKLYADEADDILAGKATASGNHFYESFSFFRFGVPIDDMYASITADGEIYQASRTIYNFGNVNALKNQPEMNPVFSKATISGGKARYDIKNGRHLYNVRYISDASYELRDKRNDYDGALASSIVSTTFNLNNDLDFGEFQKAGYLMNGYANPKQFVVSDRYSCDYPSYSKLGYADIFDGNGKTISGLNIDGISNKLYSCGVDINASLTKAAPGGLSEAVPTGMFIINYGEIKDLTLDAITVEGDNMVGAFAGVNIGVLDNLTTEKNDGSYVTGNKNVGGIVGFELPSEKETKLENLTNNISVSGKRSVGGILGAARNEFSVVSLTKDSPLFKELKNSADIIKNLQNPKNIKLTINKCDNYGAVSGIGDAGSPEDARYIGGIAGYCYNQFEDDTTLITISNCTSSPQYSEGWLFDVLADREKLKEYLIGDYVGGIAGYNHYGEINACTSKSTKKNAGYIFGYKYVGGIVGFNVGPASGIKGATSGQGVNSNNVVAWSYAGGIVGCNSNVKKKDTTGNNAKEMDPEDLFGIMIPDSKKNLDVKIANWKNEGVVIAVYEYAGGISGYNAGYIYGCNSQISIQTADKYFSKLYSGKYAGGITGYNNGVVGNTERDKQGRLVKAGKAFSSVCYVKGHTYVGGIVGYNDVDSIIEDYQISGGYVIGDANSSFIGGYAGFNASIDLLMELETMTARLINSNPGRVTGSYFVGGNVGANIINEDDVKNKVDRAIGDNIYTYFKTDNFLGILEGEEFVGGFVGYNCAIDSKHSDSWVNKDQDRDRGAVYVLQKKIATEFDRINASEKTDKEKLLERKLVLDDLNTSLGISANPAKKTIYVSGKDSLFTKSNFGRITGKICVGGALGYNDGETKLYIKDVMNATPVSAKAAVEDPFEQFGRTKDYAGKEKTFTYSYVGGIIGEVGKNTVVDNCWNSSTGSTTTQGTYTGGLCEINEGRVINCAVSNLGNGITDYIGGLCGLNKGTIDSCSIENKTISGRNVVGGITAENAGEITNIKLKKPKMNITFANVSVNGETDKHSVCGLFTGFNLDNGKITLAEDLVDVNIKANGRYAGAVAGVNAGKILNGKPGVSANNSATYLSLGGKIQSYKTAGGLIGRNIDEDSKDVISGYINNIQVIATDGNAGGIIGENDSVSKIANCANNAVVTATYSGNAGGITSFNNGVIADCYDYVTVSAPKGLCGGITAVNGSDKKATAIIENCYVAPKSTTKISFTSTISVGGICAENYATIKKCKLQGVTITNTGVDANTNMGVVCGVNKKSGNIYLVPNDYTTRDVLINVTTNYCNAGGVAGSNEGLISVNEAKQANQKGFAANTSKIDVEIKYTMATIGRLGGAVGDNKGTVEYCQIIGNIQGRFNASSTGYGGIAGINGFVNKADYVSECNSRGDSEYKPTIRNCSFDGEIYAQGSTGSPAFVGGIAGSNLYGGFIEECGLGVFNDDADGNADLQTNIVVGDSKYDYDIGDTPKYDNAAYGYLGGIAGVNYGAISAMDMDRTTVDNIKVRNNGAGTTGGVVGFEYSGATVGGYVDENDTNPTTRVHYLVTPSSMDVKQLGAENDFGVSGVIGYDVSATDVSHIINKASATCYYIMNVKVGGVIGTLQQMEKLSITIDDCINYGNVNGYVMAGGIVGRTKFCGVDFYNCKNYGDILTKGGSNDTSNSAGGIIGTIYESDPGIFLFNKCENHGHIMAKVYKDANQLGLGGIIGANAGGSSNSETNSSFRFIRLVDCVNTGMITIEAGNGGSYKLSTRLGSMIGLNRSSVVYIDECQNYSNSPSLTGFIGGTDGGQTIYSANCFDTISNTRISKIYTNLNESNRKNMYYLAQDNNISRTSATVKNTIPLYYESGLTPFNVAVRDNSSIGYKMDLNNPIADSFYSDFDDYDVSDASGVNYRYKVYLENYPKFVSMVQNTYTSTGAKLPAPTKFTANNFRGKIKLTWNLVANAYEYEVRCVITHADGSKEYTDSTYVGAAGPAGRLFYMEKPSGLVAGDSIDYQIRAVNGYRYTCDASETEKDRWDSDWVTTDAVLKMPLAKPIVHMELTPSNKFVAVLDNPEVYLVDGQYLDCYIETKYNNVIYTIDVSQGEVISNEVAMASATMDDDFQFYCTAKPYASSTVLYSDSVEYYLMGRALSNETIKRDRYLDKTYFLGFSGKDADSIIYKMNHEVINKRDLYVTCDISSYDENVKMDAVYSETDVHLASFAGTTTYLDTDIPSIPAEWFSADYDKDILVREYPNYSQNQIIHYGHDVVSNLVLDGTYEQNIAKISAVTDTHYLSEEMARIDYGATAISIWDSSKGCLKDGYILHRKVTGSGSVVYDITYNAAVELAIKEAAGTTYPYAKYCVDYMKISRNLTPVNTADELSNDIAVNVATTSNIEYMESLLLNNGVDKTLNNTFDYLATLEGGFTNRTVNLVKYTPINYNTVEIQPTPIISDIKVGSEIVGGIEKSTYTVDFDKYFVDDAVFSAAKKFYDTNNKHITDASDICATWNVFSDRVNYSTKTNNTLKLRLMNTYYFMYMPRVDGSAKYKVDLIAKTIAGQEITVDSQEVSASEFIGNMTNTDGHALSLYQYQAKFIDKDNNWDQYIGFKVRVMHLGNDKGIVNNGLNCGRYAKGDTKTYIGQVGCDVILPRYIEKEIKVKLKLNQIPKPSVTLHVGDDGQYVTDQLLYDVSFTGITDELQVKDLGGYIISLVHANVPDGAVPVIPHYYCITLPGKTLDISAGDMPTAGVVHNIAASDFTLNADGSIDTVIDFGDFNTGDDVFITVRAISVKDSDIYKSSDDGVENEITIPSRLAQPAIDKMSLVTSGTHAGMPEYSSTPVTGDEYDKGISLTYLVGADESDASNYIGATVSDVKLSIAIAVYDDPAADLAAKDMVASGDAVSGGIVYWNTGAIETLYSKANPLEYGYVHPASGDGFINIPIATLEKIKGRFAGKWLKIAVKATSATNIDSQWSDQDSAGATVNYMWVQIPMLKLDDITFTNEKVKRDYVVEGATHDDDQHYTVYNRALKFNTNLMSDGYRLHVEANTENYNIDIDKRVIGADDEVVWDVSIGGTVIGSLGPETASEEDAPVVLALKLSNIGHSLTMGGVTYDMKAELTYDPTDGTIRFVMPDITGTTEDTNLDADSPYRYIDSVTIDYYLDTENDGVVAGATGTFNRV